VLGNNQNILCLSHQNILEATRVLTHPKFDSSMSLIEAEKLIWGVADAMTLIAPLEETIYITKESGFW